jgi:hypothetical protein
MLTVKWHFVNIYYLLTNVTQLRLLPSMFQFNSFNLCLFDILAICFPPFCLLFSFSFFILIPFTLGSPTHQLTPINSPINSLINSPQGQIDLQKLKALEAKMEELDVLMAELQVKEAAAVAAEEASKQAEADAIAQEEAAKVAEQLALDEEAKVC